jgi:hypothetical protein
VLDARGSEWRDDATGLALLRWGGWFPLKSHGMLAGWSVSGSFSPPFLTLNESRDASGRYPMALAIVAGYARAAKTLDGQDVSKADRVLERLRLGIGGLGDLSRRRSRFYSRIHVALGPEYNVVISEGGSVAHQWAAFVSGHLGAGYKARERLRFGGALGGGLAFDRFIHLYQGELTADAELAWYFW